MTKRKFSPAQLRAQKLFAERARAGTLKKNKRTKKNPTTGKLYKVTARRIGETTPFTHSTSATRKIAVASFNKLRNKHGVDVEITLIEPKGGTLYQGRGLKRTARNPRSKRYPATAETGILKKLGEEYRAAGSLLTIKQLAAELKSIAPGMSAAERKRIAEKFAALEAERINELRRYENYVGEYGSSLRGPTPYRNPTKRTFGKRNLVIRATRPVKTGYKYYYLRGDEFVIDPANADKFGKSAGEKRMREIVGKLPPTIDSITLVAV